MMKLLLLILLFGAVQTMSAREPVAMKLWPKGAPSTPNTKEPEATVNRPELNGTRGPITRITNVTDPTLTVYWSPAPNGTALVVFPGGGYRWLAMNIEGSEICDRFTREGITCVVVKYRVPQPDDSTRFEQPLQDAQRAISLVRQHASEWKIDPARVGAIGFSAGAQTVTVLSNHPRTYPAQDEADEQNCKPDFAVVMYPGYLNSPNQGGSVAEDVKPSAENPPTFVFQAEDDPVHVSNSLVYYIALKNAHVPAELHIYPTGGHGYGLRSGNRAAEAWPELVVKWMASIKVLTTPR
jgi:acetyl esterase/lipase